MDKKITQSKVTSKPSLIALEPRMLFDGAAVSTAVAADTAISSVHHNPIHNADVHQVVFIDSRNSQVPAFDAPNSSVDVVWIDPSVNGMQVVTDYLANHVNLESLLMVGASDGQNFEIGSASITADNASSFAPAISSWTSSLSTAASIEVVGDSSDGLTAVANEISRDTGLNVIAGATTDSLSDSWHLADIQNPAGSSGLTDIIFVDAGVANAMQFAALASANVEVVFLNPTQDGLTQVNNYLQGYANLGGIQIIANEVGSDLNVGSTAFTVADLAAKAAEFSNISKAVSVNGSLELFAFDVSSPQLDLQKLAVFSGGDGVLEAQTLVAGNPALDNGLNEVAFIDANVNNWQQLVSAIKPGIEVVLINGNGDGLREISDYLAGNSSLDAVHIVSHGSQGEIFIGMDDITINNLADYSADLAAIGASLNSSGSILFYGCDIAGGLNGLAFVNQVSALAAGHDVQASTDLTGATSLAGDWTLEVSTAGLSKNIAFDSVLIGSYDGSLGGSYTATTGTNVDTSGSTSGLIGAGKLITFDAINITSAPTTSAYLVLNAYDVDYGLVNNGVAYPVGNASSEWDGVYIQKSGASTWQFVGYLIGTNNTWSSTTLDVTSYVRTNGSGSYIVRVVPDDNGAQTQANNGGKWVVGVSSAQVLVDGGDASAASLTSLAETDASVSSQVYVLNSGTYTVEYNLINSSGQDVASASVTQPLVGNANTAVKTTVNASLALNTNYYASGSPWSSLPSGSYTLQVTLKSATGVVLANGSLPYNIISQASIPSSGVGAIVIGPDTASWTGASVADISHTATTDTSPNITGTLSQIASTSATTYVDLYADGVYAGTASVAANSKTFALQFGAGSNSVNNTTKLLDPGYHKFTAVYAPNASGSLVANYTAGGSAVVLDSAVGITGSTSIYRVYVSIASGVTGDLLAAVTTGTNISASYSNGTLTLSGTDTVANYSAVLKTVKYSSTASDPTNGGLNPTRTINWQVRTGNSNSSNSSVVKTTSVAIAYTQPAPAIKIGSSSSSMGASYTVNDYKDSSLVPVDGAITIDSTGSLSSATVAITSNFVSAQDRLAFSNTSATSYGNIAANFDASTGVLSLTSSGRTATLAQWQAALSAVTYQNINTTSPTASQRTISFKVTGAADSNTVTSIVNVNNSSHVNYAPVLSGGGNVVSITQSNTSTTINSNLAVTDPDTSTYTGATVSIISNFSYGSSSYDTLSFNNSSSSTYGNISGSYSNSTGILTLTSSGNTATKTQWESALKAVKYSWSSSSNNNNNWNNGNSISTASDRVIEFKLSQSAGDTNSNRIVTKINLGKSSGSTFTTTTRTVSSTVTDAIDLGSVSSVAQSTSFSSTATVYNLLIDSPSTLAPTITTIDGTLGLSQTTDRSPTLSGKSSAGVSLELYDGSTLIGSTTSDVNGDWSFSLVGVESLANGTYTFTVKDKVNSLTGTYNLAVSSDVPTITITNIDISADTGASSSDFITATTSQTITATLSGLIPTGSFLYGSVDGGVTWTDVTSSVSGTSITWLNRTLRTGYMDADYNQYSIKFRVQNSAGAGAVAEQGYYVTPSLDDPLITSTNYQVPDQPSLIGTADPHSILTITYVVNGSTFTATVQPSASGAWTFTVPSPLANGTYTFTVSAADPLTGASAVHAATQNVTVDTSLPTISNLAISIDSGQLSTDQITNVSDQTITATLSRNLVANEVLYGSVDGGQTWSAMTSYLSGTSVRWTHALLTGGKTGDAIIDGINVIEFKVVKTTTSASSGIAQLSYRLDTTAPVDLNAVVDPKNSTVTLNFVDTGSGFDLTSIPPASRFFISASNASTSPATVTSLTISSVAFLGNTSVVLTYSGYVVSALDTITVGYNWPLGGSFTGNTLKDVAGNAVVGFDPSAYNPISIIAHVDNVNAYDQTASATGNLLSNDAGDSLTVSQADVGTIASFALDTNPTKVTLTQGIISNFVGTYGSLTLNMDGSFSYLVDSTNSSVQALNTNSSPLQDVFTYEAIDASGNVSKSTLTVSVYGVNNSALIAGTSTASVTEKGGVNNATSGQATATGTLTASDVDNTANTFAVASSGSSTTNGYGTYAMASDGVWTYTLDDANSVVQALNSGGTLTDSFTVRSIDGTSQVVTVTILGANDAPTASSISNVNGSATQALAFTIPAFTDVDNTITYTATLSDGSPLPSWLTFTSSTRSFSGTPLAAAIYTIKVVGSDGLLSANQTFTLNVLAAGAIGSTNDSGSATEAGGLSNSTLGSGSSGNVLTNDVGASIAVTDVMKGTSGSYELLVSNTKTITGDYGTLVINSDGSYIYTVNNNNLTVQALNVGSSLTDQFTYKIADNSSPTPQVASAILTITIAGENDIAVISGTSTGSVIEKSGVSNAVSGSATATGTLTSLDVDNLATFAVASSGSSTTNGYGTYAMSSNGEWTYTLDDTNVAVQALNSGGTLTDTFTVTSVDGTSKEVRITINGRNDAAVISGTSTGSVTEKSGLNNGTSGTATATGTLTASDVDNTANLFTVASSGSATANGYGTYAMASNGVWTYTLDDTNSVVQALNVGQSVTDTFTVTSADGTSQVVTITIDGRNDAAVIAGTSTGSVDNTSSDPVIGTLTSADIDNPASTFIPVTTANASANGYGTFTIDSSGSWIFNLNPNNSVVNQLAAGQQLTETFVVSAVDGTQKTVTITITAESAVAYNKHTEAPSSLVTIPTAPVVPMEVISAPPQANNELESNGEINYILGKYAVRTQFLKPTIQNALLTKSVSVSDLNNQATKTIINNINFNFSSNLHVAELPPDAIAKLNGRVDYTIPSGTFNGGAGAIKLIALQIDGSALPKWIKFDGATGKIIADVPADLHTPIRIKIEAVDDNGDKADTVVTIVPKPSPQGFVGKPSLTAQMKSMSNKLVVNG